jgi:hypothetical protein
MITQQDIALRLQRKELVLRASPREMENPVIHSVLLFCAILA